MRSIWALPLLLAAALAPLVACKSADGGAALASKDAPEDNGRAKLRQAFKAPIRELSGLARVPGGAPGQPVLVAIGDHDFTALRMRLLADLRDIAFEAPHDLRSQFLGEDASQWEGVATEAGERVLILEEFPSRVFVVDPTLTQRLQTIRLDFGALADEIKLKDNSLGEGLALMARGHILVLKEKKPPMLVEFGPKGDAPLGVSPETLLAPGVPFAVAPGAPGATVAFEPLKTWEFTGKTQEALADFSEIAVGPDATIYLLSDESARIGRLEGNLRVSEDKVTVKATWDLPKDIEHPEGLVFVGDWPVVGCDLPEGKKNLFVLEPLGK